MMTDPNLGRKKKKITYIASPQGVERAEKALRRLRFESKLKFAESRFLARGTVTKFFQRQPIQLDSFKRICEALQLNYEEILETIEEEKSERLEIEDCSTPDINEGVEQVPTLRPIEITDQQSQTIKVVITLRGDINSTQNRELFYFNLRQHSGDSIEIIDIQEGSIKLIIEGSQEDIQRLLYLIESKELTEVNGFPVENVQVVDETSDDDKSAKLNNKWRLVQEIVGQQVLGRDLKSADLSDANLSGVYLKNANLGGADLSGADLSEADLSEADLSEADLSEVDLRSANLSEADLSEADLSHATLLCTNLSHATLSRANLSGVELRGVSLSHADLSNANLSNIKVILDADLSDADLSHANLSDADLSDADLSRADLSDADLSRANLNLAKVEEARFGRNKGLTEALKIYLQKRGARFEDSPGDRSPVPSRR